MTFWKIKPVKENIFELLLNRPEKLNAFTWDSFLTLPAAVKELEEKKAKVVILKGEGGNFSSGLDFKDFFTNNPDISQSAEILEEKIRLMQEGFMSLRNANFISVASVSGYCIGAGVDLISLCDLRFGSADLRLCLRELEFGIIPDLGALNFLPEIIGTANTKYLCFTTQGISAKEAERIGLLYKAYENSELLQEAVLEVAENIAQKPTLPLLHAKQMINNKSSLENLAKWNAEFLTKSGILLKLLS